MPHLGGLLVMFAPRVETSGLVNESEKRSAIDLWADPLWSHYIWHREHHNWDLNLRLEVTKLQSL